MRISTLSDVGSLVLTPLLPAFLARNPRVRPELVMSPRNVDLAREGFDVGVRVSLQTSMPPSSLIAKKLGAVNIALYAGTQYAARRELPKQLSDLTAHDHVVYSAGDTFEYHAKGPKGVVKIKVPSRVCGDDFFFIREAVVAGWGSDLADVAALERLHRLKK